MKGTLFEMFNPLIFSFPNLIFDTIVFKNWTIEIFKNSRTISFVFWENEKIKKYYFRLCEYFSVQFNDSIDEMHFGGTKPGVVATPNHHQHYAFPWTKKITSIVNSSEWQFFPVIIGSDFHFGECKYRTQTCHCKSLYMSFLYNMMIGCHQDEWKDFVSSIIATEMNDKMKLLAKQITIGWKETQGKDRNRFDIRVDILDTVLLRNICGFSHIVVVLAWVVVISRYLFQLIFYTSLLQYLTPTHPHTLTFILVCEWFAIE